jgi:hypothetical protein
MRNADVEGSTADLLQVAAPYRVQQVVTHEPDLEEIFLAYYQRSVRSMFGNVFLKTIRDQRRTLLGWGIGIVLLVGFEAALWPSIRDMPDLKNFLANYPEAMKELFNLDAMTTPSGFMNAEPSRRQHRSSVCPHSPCRSCSSSSASARSRTAATVRSCVTGGGPSKVKSILRSACTLSLSTASTMTRRPDLMIATVSATASTSYRMWEDRKTVRP